VAKAAEAAMHTAMTKGRGSTPSCTARLSASGVMRAATALLDKISVRTDASR